MKKSLLFALALPLLSACTTDKPDRETQALAGLYTLQGVMEMGSLLRLRADGSFEGNVAYGAADGYAKGTWRRVGGQVVLKPKAVIGLGELFRDRALRVDGLCLRIAAEEGGGYYLRSPH